MRIFSSHNQRQSNVEIQRISEKRPVHVQNIGYVIFLDFKHLFKIMFI